MFSPNNLKRPSPETFDQNTWPKRLFLPESPSSKDLNGHICFQSRSVAHVTVESSSQRSFLVPPNLVTTSQHHRKNHVGLGVPEDHTQILWPTNNEPLNFVPEERLVSDDAIESFDVGISLTDEEDAAPEVCFGVIIMPVVSTSSISETDMASIVDLEAFGDCVKIKLQSSCKYAGLIRSPAIRQLMDEPRVQLSTTLVMSSSSSFKSARKSVQTTSSHEFTTRIVIIGAKEERTRIGMVLSAASLFLQYPYAEECGDLEYANPHYLLRPGASMPPLHKSATFRRLQAAPSGALNEVNRNRIMQLFDAASLDCPQLICPKTFTSRRLKSELKHHQLKAAAWMIEKEGCDIESCRFPSLWEITRLSEQSKKYRNVVTGVYGEHVRPPTGGILADDMGLGKTLSTLNLICLSLDFKSGSQDVAHKTLVVTPNSTLPGWETQINRHIHDDQLRTALYHGSNRHLFTEHFEAQDVVFTTYETLRKDYEANGPLYKSQWHRVVLDEAHHIRNRKSQVFTAACSIKSTFRCCLTGTPVHNSLDDYCALLSFLGVPIFNTKTMFDNWITRPIRNKNSEGFKRLQILVKVTCLRRTKESVGDALDLPPRREEIQFVRLHPDDQKLYNFFKDKATELASGVPTSEFPAVASSMPSSDNTILPLLNFLRLACNHGLQILPESALKQWNSRDGTLDRRNEDEVMVNGENGGIRVFSAKVIALLNKLVSAHTPSFDKRAQYTPVKSVVFTYWSKMLDLIQPALSTYHLGSCRIDGSTSLEGRFLALKKFNEDPECSVMLATIGSAGEGLDLTIANHVHLVEPHWNPMVEAQAVDRVYRIGQQREVTVTRYVVPESIETYIQWVQQQKLRLISKIIDTDAITQADIQTARWKQLKEHLGIPS